MKRGKMSVLVTLVVQLPLLIILLGGSVSADPLVDVLFDQSLVSKPGAIVKGGTFLEDGQGWRSNTVGDMIPAADQVLIELPASLPSMGYIEFELKRLSDNTGYGKDQSPYETALELVDGNGLSLLIVHVSWERIINGRKVTSLHFAGDGYDKVLQSKPFGNIAVFDRLVQPGETVVIRLKYGDSALSNRILMDGAEAVNYLSYKGGWVPASREGALGTLIRDVETLRLGVEMAGEDVFHSPLYFSSLIALRIIGPPVISQFNHNAFSVIGYSGKLVVGNTVKVTLIAEPGGNAIFDLGKTAGLPMRELSDDPGTYTGTYDIRFGDEIEAGQVVGHFTNSAGLVAEPAFASRTVDIDTRVYLNVRSSNDLVPADRSARAGISVQAVDANGKAVQGHELKLTLSTTDEYTGLIGGGSFEDTIGGTVDVDWGGITDSFGEVTGQYLSGFAAKTILVSAKDMSSGDVGVGFVRSFIDGAVDIIVTRPSATALSVAGSMNISLSRDWLTADGQSRSRITATLKDASGGLLTGHSVRFALFGENGTIRVVQGKTDSRGRAIADYIAGTYMGQVQIEVRDLTSGMVTIVPIELRPDAPAEITLVAEPGEVNTDGQSTITASVSDANGNPNSSADVLFDVVAGPGALSVTSVGTDEDGVASVIFLAGSDPGLATVKGTVISREPAEEEISAAEGAVFLFGLEEDPGRLDVVEWVVKPGDEVVEGQPLVTLEDGTDVQYTVVAPRDGAVSTFMAEERDRVGYGDTLGYVIEVAD